jgi:hypothetical protein
MYYFPGRPEENHITLEDKLLPDINISPKS